MKRALISGVKNCLFCGNGLDRKIGEGSNDWRSRKFCGRQCYYRHNTKENHYFWKGGIKTRPDGYLIDSKTGKYIHRLVMENYLGRPLTKEENIHHIDGNPKNNNIENLIIYSNSEHRKIEVLAQPRNSRGVFVAKEVVFL